MGSLLQFAVAAFVLWLVYHFLIAGHADFTISLRKGQVTYAGRIALAQQQSLADFLLEDMELHGPLTIFGCRRKGRLHIWFRGPLSPGEKQRIRNFLVTS